MTNHHHKKILKLCPECYHTKFMYDEIHHETYCKNCGLILIAPPEADHIFPGYLIININPDKHYFTSLNKWINIKPKSIKKKEIF